MELEGKTPAVKSKKVPFESMDPSNGIKKGT